MLLSGTVLLLQLESIPGSSNPSISPLFRPDMCPFLLTANTYAARPVPLAAYRLGTRRLPGGISGTSCRRRSKDPVILVEGDGSVTIVVSVCQVSKDRSRYRFSIGAVVLFQHFNAEALLYEGHRKPTMCHSVD